MSRLPILISLLLTLLAFPVLPLAHIAFIRFSQKGRVRLMMYAFILYGTLWVFLSRYMIGGSDTPGIWLMSGGYLATFLFLGYAECFSMLGRGFSLQILCDIYRHNTRTRGQLLGQYGGRGINWMLEKRIHTLELLGMVERQGNTLFLKRLGVIVGRGGILVKRILMLGKGG